jgi:hypothetical protein
MPMTIPEMSLISLEKFLYGPRVSESPASPYYEMVRGILDSVGQCILEGDAVSDLREQLGALRSGLEPSANSPGSTQAAFEFDSLMGAFRERLKLAERERGEELRKVLTFLNEALVHLRANGKRSDSRLKALEISLLQAASTNDLRTLKTHLSQMLAFVRTEAASEGRQSETAVDRMTSQIQEVRQTAGRFGASPKGRTEAMNLLKHVFQGPAPGKRFYGGLYAVDSARVMRARYGHETVQCLLDDLAAKRVQPAAPTGQLFYWSPESILLIFSSEEELPAIQGRIATSSGSPFPYQAFLGSRIATLNVNTRWVILPVEGSPEEMTWAMDRFVSGSPPC